MAARFWVLDTGTWDASDTTHWSDSSGGVGGASVPVDGDTVTFDANSCLLSGTITLGYSPTVTSITMGAFTGTFDASTFSPTMNTFSFSGTGIRTISMGSGTWTIRGNNTTIIDGITSTNLTFNAGTAVVNCTYSGATGTRAIRPGLGRIATINVTAGTDIVSTANEMGSYNFTGFKGSLTILGTTSVYGDLTLDSGMTTNSSANGFSMRATSGTELITTNGVVLNMPFTIDGVGGTLQLQNSLSITGTLTLTNGTFNANNFNVTCGAFSSSNSNTRVLTMGSGTWTLTGNNATIWTTATTTGLTITANTATINCTYSGATGTRTLTTGASAALGLNNVNITAGTDIIALTTTFFCADLSFAGFTGTLTNTSITASGSVVLGTGMTVTGGTGTSLTFTTSASKTLTTNGVAFNRNINLSGTGTITLQDSLSLAGATSGRSVALNTGTFNANNFNYTAASFSSSNSNVRTLTMGSGTWNLTGTGTVWDMATITNLTLTEGTSTIVINDASATNKTFAGGGETFNNIYFTGAGTGQLIFTGSNTFNQFSVDTAPKVIRFTAATNTTVTGWNVRGFEGQNIDIASVTAATHTLTKLNPGVIESNYLTLTNSIAAGTGAVWYAGSNSTDDGGNSGWIFTNNPVSPGTGGGGGRSFGKLASLGSLSRL